MSHPPVQLVIDARPRGPRGPFAGERVQGGTVLDHLLNVASQAGKSDKPISIYVRFDEQERVASWIAGASRFVVALGSPPEGCAVLRTDRLYDAARLDRALKRGRDPESAVIWRLDQPHALEGADDELTRRQSFQPLGRYWALEPARRLARVLAPTIVRPNALTLMSASLVLGASALVASPWHGWASQAAVALALAMGLVLDTADGHLARLQGTSSSFGRWLDGWLDEVGDMALHAAIAWAAFMATNQPGWLLLGIAYASGKFIFFVGMSDPVEKPASGSPAITGRPRPSSGLQNIVRFVGHADLRWHLWIILGAIGRLDLALVAYAIYYPIRSVAMAVKKGVNRG